MVSPMLPLLILQLIKVADQLIPFKTLLTHIAKCEYCHEMYEDGESRFDEDTEEITVHDFNMLAESGVPVMQQLIKPPGEEDEEKPSKRKIGFGNREDE